jgi:DNA-binding NarL/FixJ family response regulator
MSRKPTRVLIVDDHAFVREMLGLLLARDPAFEVIGTAGSAGEALEIAGRREPDIVVMDIDMPGLICFEAARKIREQHAEVRLLFLSAHVHDHYVEEAMRAGADGYLTKNASPEEVLRALRLLAERQTVFAPEVLARLTLLESEPAAARRSKLSTLTLREVDVLTYIAKGYSKKEIAALMRVSMKTVEKHSQNLMGKLDIHDRVELTHFAIREGLVEI